MTALTPTSQALQPTSRALDTVLDVRMVTVDGTENGLGLLLGTQRPARASVASRGGFSCEPVGLVRAALHTSLGVPQWPDVQDHSPDGLQRCRAWLRQVWAVPAVADAVRHASPDLAGDLDRVNAGATVTAARLQRLVVRLGGYVLRAECRATPFGLFAGVAPLRFASRQAVRWGSEHRAAARAGGRWLADMVTRLEAMPGVRSRVRVMVNSALVERGDRLVVPWRPRGLDSTPLSGTAIEEVSLRATPIVRSTLGLAGVPLPYAALVDKIAADHQVSPEAASSLVDQMIDARVLLTSLNTPSTTLDALDQLVAELRDCGAAESPEAKSLVDDLDGILSLLREHNRSSARDGMRLRRTLARRMSELSGAQDPLALDLLLDAEVRLPHAVAQEIAAAAGVLARISRQPHGMTAWRIYHQRFLQRYGCHTLVPVTDLLDAEVGLGLPQGYLGAGAEPILEPTPRDRRLLALAQAATAMRRAEVVLDDKLIRELCAGDPETMRVPAHLEVAAEVHAADQQALDDGAFQLVLTSVSRAWGTLSGGRLAALLDATVDDGIRTTLAGLPIVDGDALPAQLSFPSLSPSGSHVARTPQLLPTVISVGEHRSPGPGVITPADLAVGADEHRMYLVSLSRQRRIEPVTFHPLQPWFHMPPLVRFLSELPRGRAAVMDGGFDWGLASEMPFLPRLRHRRTVLAPARWRLDTLPGPGTTMHVWEAALRDLRSDLRIPGTVLLTDWDKRLRVDLDIAGHRALLRSHLERSTTHSVTLTEAGPEHANGWAGGRAHELVALLRADEPARNWPTSARTSAVRSQRGQARLPGDSAWLTVSLPASRRRQRDIITEYLPQLLAGMEPEPRWWFRCGDHHLYLHLQHRGPRYLPTAMSCIATWARDLSVRRVARGEDLALIAYRRDEGRWGDGAALHAAEDVFVCDSRVLAQQLRHQAPADRQVNAAATLLAIAAAFTGTHQDAIRWLIDHPLPAGPEPLPRDARKDVIRLADPASDFHALRSHAVPPHLTEAWTARGTALTAYRHQLREDTGPDPDQILDALLTDHLERLTHRDAEETLLIRRLARAAALAHHARTGRPKQ